MSVFKLAAWTLGLFHSHFVGINFATLDTVKNRLGTFRLIEVLVAKIVISPEQENGAYPDKEINKKSVCQADGNHVKHKRALDSGAFEEKVSRYKILQGLLLGFFLRIRRVVGFGFAFGRSFFFSNFFLS